MSNPYQPPASRVQDTEVDIPAGEVGADFKDPTALTNWTRWLLLIQLAVAVIALLGGILEYRFLHDLKAGVYASDAEAGVAAQASDTRQQLIGVAQFIAFVLTGILILTWIHRANFNARQLGAAEMKFTPGWAVGWYFIPIANLWKPYDALREIWKASANPRDWKEQVVPPLVGWWWFFWIVSNLLANASMRLTPRANDVDQIIQVNVFTMVANASDIPLNLVFLVIVSRIFRMQMSNYRELVRT